MLPSLHRLNVTATVELEHQVYPYNSSQGRAELLFPILEVETHVRRGTKPDSTRISSPDRRGGQGTAGSIYQDANSVMHPKTEQAALPQRLRLQTETVIVQCQHLLNMTVLRKQHECLISAAGILEPAVLTHGLQDKEHVI